MSRPELVVVLAQHAGHGSGGGQTVMTVFLIAVLAAVWVALGVVCWIFWRAKKREDEAREGREVEWSARSS